MGFEMTAPVGYAIYSTFSALQLTMQQIPFSLRCIAEAKASFRRYLGINTFKLYVLIIGSRKYL